MADEDRGSLPRWELFRLLGEPVRLRLLALCAEEELSIGELAELLDEAQPNVSRHVKPLREAGLLSMRKEGTRVLVRLPASVAADSVVAEAVREGRVLATEDGSLARVADVVRAREHEARVYFDSRTGGDPTARASEFGAYVALLGALLPSRRLAVDVGTGDGRLLDALAPAFERVVAVDRSPAQLALAEARCRARGYANVELVEASLDDEVVPARIRRRGPADVVFLSRVLHHAASPAAVLRTVTAWLAPGGRLVVLDYASHDDESMRERVKDLWLGFGAKELVRLALESGLVQPTVLPIGRALRGDGPDAHLDWHALVCARAEAPEPRRTRARSREERAR